MGQKTDARIFRQGLKKNWEIRYLEKNDEESSLYLYKILEIQKYLNRFFGLYKIKIHRCRIFYSDSSLHIFISFYASTKTLYIIKKEIYENSSKKKENCKPSYILKEFQELLIQNLAKYTKNKINIFITLQSLNLNKQLSYAQMNCLKKIYKQLKKFTKRSFFKEAVNILFLSISKRKSAKLLAEFLSDQFKLNQFRSYEMTVRKKDNFFLGFLKQSIMLLVKSEFSCLIGIKIVIKGRFNKVPRATTHNIQLGNFSLQSFNSKIDYYQSTAFTINGTFGIKVWLCENN